MAEIVLACDFEGNNVANAERDLAMRPEETGRYCLAGQLLLIGAGPVYGVAVRHRDKPAWPLGLDFTAGGMANPGEDALSTTLRETREELGIVLGPADVRPVASWVPRDGFLSRATVFAARWEAGRPVPFNRDDIEEIRWMTAGQLRDAANDISAVMKPDFRIYVLSGLWPPAI